MTKGNKFLAGMLLIIVSLSLNAKQQSPEGFATAWLDIIDRGDYVGAYRYCNDNLISKLPLNEWESRLKETRGVFGAVVSRELVVEYDLLKNDLKRNQQSVNLSYKFQTQVQSGVSFYEIVALEDSKSGGYEITGYFIKPLEKSI